MSIDADCRTERAEPSRLGSFVAIIPPGSCLLRGHRGRSLHRLPVVSLRAPPLPVSPRPCEPSPTAPQREPRPDRMWRAGNASSFGGSPIRCGCAPSARRATPAPVRRRLRVRDRADRGWTPPPNALTDASILRHATTQVRVGGIGTRPGARRYSPSLSSLRVVSWKLD